MSLTECPHCGGKAIPIVYGTPGLELFEQAKRGEVRLDGCVVKGDGHDPTHYCPACDAAMIAEDASVGEEDQMERPRDDMAELYRKLDEVGSERLTPEERDKLGRDRARRFTWEEGDIVWEPETEPEHEKQG